MTQYKRNVLFWSFNDCLNRDLEDDLKKKKADVFFRKFLFAIY